MSTIKRRLSGTRTFAASTYTNNNSDTPVAGNLHHGSAAAADGGPLPPIAPSTSFAAGGGGASSAPPASSFASFSGPNAATTTTAVGAGSGGASLLAGPLPIHAQPLDAEAFVTHGGQKQQQLQAATAPLRKPPTVVRMDAVPNISVPLQRKEAQKQRQEETTKIAALQQRLRELAPVPKPRDTLTKTVPVSVLRRVASFVADTNRGLAPFASMCRATRAAATHCVSALTLVPTETSVDAISRGGALVSFSHFVKRGDKGAHVRSFSVIDPKFVYSLDSASSSATTVNASASPSPTTAGAQQQQQQGINAPCLGPSLSPVDLLRTIGTMPQLTTIDVRGVALRDYVAWSDHFLADVSHMCPLLQVLRVGVTFAKAWPRGWWHPISGSLKEFVIGSRREDAEFLSERRMVASLRGARSAAAAAVAPSPKNNNADIDDGEEEEEEEEIQVEQLVYLPISVPLVPLQLPLDDLLAMARNTPLATLKIWPALPFPHMSQLMFPSAPIPALRSLSLTVGAANAALIFTSEGDALIARDREGAGAHYGGDGAGGGGGGGKMGGGRSGGGAGGAAAAASNPRGAGGNARGGGGGAAAAAAAAIEEAQRAATAAAMYPNLMSFTVADVNSKPDLASDILQKMMQVAPNVEHWNVTNTHRQGPTANALVAAASQQRTRRPHAPTS